MAHGGHSGIGRIVHLELITDAVMRVKCAISTRWNRTPDLRETVFFQVPYRRVFQIRLNGSLRYFEIDHQHGRVIEDNYFDETYFIDLDPSIDEVRPTRWEIRIAKRVRDNETVVWTPLIPRFRAKGRRLKRVKAFAIRAHARQRYAGKPYSVHLQEVVNVIRSFGPEIVGMYSDETYHEALQAAWLHDVIEDTAVTRDDLAARFGDRLAQIADDLAIRQMEKSGKEEGLRDYFARVGSDPVSALVKVADRIANSRQTMRSRDIEMARKYSSQRELLVAAVGKLIPHDMKLAFLFIDSALCCLPDNQKELGT